MGALHKRYSSTGHHQLPWNQASSPLQPWNLHQQWAYHYSSSFPTMETHGEELPLISGKFDPWPFGHFQLVFPANLDHNWTPNRYRLVILFLSSKWLLNHWVWLSIELETNFESWEGIPRILEILDRGHLATFRPFFQEASSMTQHQMDIYLFPAFLTSFWFLNHKFWLRNELVWSSKSKACNLQKSQVSWRKRVGAREGATWVVCATRGYQCSHLAAARGGVSGLKIILKICLGPWHQVDLFPIFKTYIWVIYGGFI